VSLLRRLHGVSLIQAEGLTKRFGSRTAIQDVDLDVPPGVCFGFLGPNGAGKTTLIRLLLGLARPDAGRVLIGGIDVQADPRGALRHVGAIVEEPRFHLHLTGVENLTVHAAIADPASVARIPEALDRVGLLERGGDKVKGYSLGMRQRLGVARAMMTEPALLILDEPSNGLDAEGMAEFRRLVRTLVEREGRTVFLSSHLLDEMEKLCDEVAIVEQGRVVERSSVRLLLAEAGVALILDVDDPARARELLAHPSIEITDAGDGSLRLAGVSEREQAMAIVKRLVDHGIGVAQIRRDRQSLEQRYLDITRGGQR
jgi:ABC-2 type transport system ATP-binding protein